MLRFPLYWIALDDDFSVSPSESAILSIWAANALDYDFFSLENLQEKEKLQENLENHMKNNDIDSAQFKDLMVKYGKKFAGLEEKQIEDLIGTRKVEQYNNIMKGIGDIKYKIDYLDLKETYLDSFLSIGKFDQGATLMKIK